MAEFMRQSEYGHTFYSFWETHMQTYFAIGAIAGITAVAGAQLNLGLFEGGWENTTFGSSGGASMLIESLGGADVQITVDLDGFVFGGADPDPFVITGSVGATGFVPDAFDDENFGEMSGGVDENGVVAIDLANAAGGSFSLVTLRGTAIGDSVDLDYEIFTPAAGVPFAVGVLNLERVPSPGGMALFAIGGLMVTRRKR
tara:strand:- start:7817 stop:8416 length:600 start_codon:yes stop_codon:yes gene_type:complete